jgi:UDP-N-acetylglucosamine 4,6-dehydratase
MMVLRSFVNDASKDIDGAEILVTGGSGSFGKKFIKTILENYSPRRVVVFSRDEHKQYEMAREFIDHQKKIRYFIGDVRDLERLNMAFRGIDIVIHAAALKHVSTAEYNPFECVKTNIIGAENVVHAAIQSKVKKVIALSTDKACNPINLYGASKLASDKIFVAAGNLTGGMGTKFSVVRYGNVVGSRGSVVPLFLEMKKNGSKELPITDDRMTRFWISLDQGVNFVLSSLRGMNGGEIFIPKIPSMKITDLATALAPGLPINIIGIRPGEKLHEVMVSEDDARNTLALPDRYIIEPTLPLWTDCRTNPEGATLVDDNFRYDSSINDEWVTEDEIMSMIGKDSF